MKLEVTTISDEKTMSKEKKKDSTGTLPESEQNQQKPTFQHYLIAVIVILIIFGNIALTIAESQYGYYAIQKERNISSVVSASKQSLCEANTSSASFKEQQSIQSETADWYAYCNLATTLPALLMALLVGSWSDRIGRRLALFIPTVGIIVKSAFIAVAIYLDWSVYTLIIAFFLQGLSGTWITIVTISYSYAADLTKYGKNRTFGIVLMEITMGVGVIAGAIGSGYMIKYIGFLYGTILICGITSVGAVLTFFLPESVQKTDKLTSISQKQYLKNALQFYIKKDPLRWKFQVLAIVFAVTELANLGRVSVHQLYVMNSPFCWSSLQIGYFAAARNFVQMVVGLSLSRLLQKFMSERVMCIAGTVSAIGFYILTTLATNDLMLYFSECFNSHIYKENNHLSTNNLLSSVYTGSTCIVKICKPRNSV